MNKKKIISVVTLLLFLFTLFPAGSAFSLTDEEEVFLEYFTQEYTMSPDDPIFEGNEGVYHSATTDNPHSQEFIDLALPKINDSIEEAFGVPDYYPEEIQVGGETLKVNAQFIRERRIVVYGNPQAVDRTLEGGNERSAAGYYRYLGYDRDKTPVTNPRFDVTSGPRPFNPSQMVWDTSESAQHLADSTINQDYNIKYRSSTQLTRARAIRPNPFSYSEVVLKDRQYTFKDGTTQMPLTDFLSYHIAYSAVLVNFLEGFGVDHFNTYGIRVPEARTGDLSGTFQDVSARCDW